MPEMICVEVDDVVGLTIPEGPTVGRVVVCAPIGDDVLLSVDVGDRSFYRCVLASKIDLWIPRFILQLAQRLGRGNGVLVSGYEEGDAVDYRIDLSWQHHRDTDCHYLVLRHRYQQFWIAFLHTYSCYVQSEPFFVDEEGEQSAHGDPEGAYHALLDELLREEKRLEQSRTKLAEGVRIRVLFHRFDPDFRRVRFVINVLKVYTGLSLKDGKKKMEDLLEHGSIEVELLLGADVERCLHDAAELGVYGRVHFYDSLPRTMT